MRPALRCLESGVPPKLAEKAVKQQEAKTECVAASLLASQSPAVP
jgi:hypothetical protein